MPNERRYQFSIRRMLLSITAIVVVCVAFVNFVDFAVNGSDGIAFRRHFYMIDAGMSEDDVVAMLGTPDFQTSDFRLGQYPGYESAYERAEKSNSSYYLIYEKGIDLVYAIGIDSEGLVTIREVGGT